ncbi:MAG: protein kinase [Gracilibacteraceae bacterium]|jgi:hypothetical protein|nr:protein kinase [Gracilibacteraceae bacterium]
MDKRCNNCFAEYEPHLEVCPECGYAEGDQPEELYHLRPGMVLRGRYIIGRVLGIGGFGITYKAWDKNLEAVMAIKEYFPSGLVTRTPGTTNVILYAGNRAREYNHGVARFLDEAKNMARFSSHRNIINVFEFFEDNNTAYIVMEFLDGVSLGEFVKSSRLGPETCLDIVASVCAALKEIHQTGIVHRDVSPDNIFLCLNNVVKLIDFGAARFSSSEETRMTIILKPGFAPPEQYNKVDAQGPWTDIYALGATMYLMTTGVKPDESTNRKIADTLAPPHVVNPAIPEHISYTIMKAMAVDKHLRFTAIADFEKALFREKKVLPLERERKLRRWRRLITVVGTALVALVAATVFLLNWNQQRLESTLPDASIAMWYALTGNEAADAAKTAAYESIVEAFSGSFPNVTVELASFAAADYAAALTEAAEDGALPAMFASDGLDLENLEVLALSNLLNALGREDYYFLADYVSYFPEWKQIPLGFIAPAVYINTGLSDFSAAGLKDVEALVPEEEDILALVVSADREAAFAYSYGEWPKQYRGEVSAEAREIFFRGGALAYFADTVSFFDVQREMPARYKLLHVDRNRILAEFAEVWSVGARSRDDQRVVERLLTFMLSDNGQDMLFVRQSGGALPLNRNALDLFCDVYNDYGNFFANIDDYDFPRIERGEAK